MGGPESAAAALAGAGEMGVFWVAAVVLFRRAGLTLAESGAYAVIGVLMAFSFLFQSVFLIRFPLVSLAVESVGLGWAVRVIAKNKKVLSEFRQSLRENLRRRPFAFWVFGVAFVYLAAKAFLGGTETFFWPRPFHGFQGTGPVIGKMMPGTPEPPWDPGAVNVQALPYLFFRWRTGLGAGWIGLWAYAGIGFSTYALARRYAWSDTAACVTLMVLSFPRFVHHAVSPGTEIVPAAFAAFSVLAMYRLVEQLKTHDLVLLAWAVFFQAASSPMGLVFPFILTALAFKVSYHRHGMFSWRVLVFQNRKAAALSVVPVILFSQAWRLIAGVRAGNPWIGSHGGAYNTEGIYGAGANLLRYLLQAFQVPESLDRFLAGVTGTGWNDLLARITTAAMETLQGGSMPTGVLLLSSPDARFLPGFGPFGVLFLWPALLWALFRGPRRLKAVSVALLVYVYAVVLILAWRPENISYFNVFYAAGGFCMAFLLPPWRLTATGRRTLQAVSTLILAAACYRL